MSHIRSHLSLVDFATMQGQPPWIMWGVANTVGISTDPTTPPLATSQLAKVANRYPTCWGFFFWCKVLNNPNSQGSSVQASFDLIMGVGRSNAVIPGFVLLQPLVAGSASTAPGAIAWASTLQSLGQFVPGSPSITPVTLTTDRIIASEIQCNARVALLGGTAGNAPVEVEVGAQFAPITHVRPSWYVGEFAGDEKGGR